MQNFSLSLCRCKKDFLKWEYFNVLVALLPVNRGSGAIPAQHLIRSLPNDPREAVLYFNRGNTVSTINNQQQHQQLDVWMEQFWLQALKKLPCNPWGEVVSIYKPQHFHG